MAVGDDHQRMSCCPLVGRRMVDRPAQRHVIGAGIGDRRRDDRRRPTLRSACDRILERPAIATPPEVSDALGVPRLIVSASRHVRSRDRPLALVLFVVVEAPAVCRGLRSSSPPPTPVPRHA